MALDGRTENFGLENVIQPLPHGRHRPDAVGVSVDGRRCVGEAKTASDVTAERTREELIDFLDPKGDYDEVILGYPGSADSAVQRVLRMIGASDCPQLDLIRVPDELLDEN